MKLYKCMRLLTASLNLERVMMVSSATMMVMQLTKTTADHVR